MKNHIVTTLIFLFILSSCLLAQDFSGSFILQDYSPAVTLKLTQDDNGKVVGVMNLEGDDYEIEAQQEGNELNGFINDFGNLIKFSGSFIDENLHLTIYDPEAAANEYGENTESDFIEYLKANALLKDNLLTKQDPKMLKNIINMFCNYTSFFLK